MVAPCQLVLTTTRRLLVSRAASKILGRGLATEAMTQASRRRELEGIREHPHKDTHRLCTGIVLNRAPILTPWPTVFERAFYKYQTRIARALSNPFPYEFYFQPGSLFAVQFRRDELKRDSMAFGREYVLRERLEARKTNKLLEALEEEGGDATSKVNLASRTSEADEKGEMNNLNRRGDRNLYLMVRMPHEWAPWHFPYGSVKNDEQLHEAMQRHMDTMFGTRLDTWIVARKPIGFLDQTRKLPEEGKMQDKIFFLKAHILAGQVRLKRHDKIGHFAWFTKQEIQERVTPEYWNDIKDMLSDV